MDTHPSCADLTTEELFRRHARFVSRFLTRLGVPSESLEDALQEVFLVAHRNGGYRAGVAHPTSYLASIAIRAARHHGRRRGVARQRHSEAAVDCMPAELEDPARALQAREDLLRLQQALAQLPEQLCTVLVLVELEGESCVSVAAGLGCPVGTVYWRLHQARKELQAALKAARGPRRRAAPASERRAQLSRSFVVLFGVGEARGSELSRLLQRAREQPPASIPIDELRARHLKFVQSAQPPAWASRFAPYTPSWPALAGVGPVTAGATVAGAILAAMLVMAYRTPSVEADTGRRANARSVEPSKPVFAALAEQPAESAHSAMQSATPYEAPSVRVTRQRQPKSGQLRARGLPASTSATTTPRSAATSTSTSLTAADEHAYGLRDHALTGARPVPSVPDGGHGAIATPAAPAAPASRPEPTPQTAAKQTQDAVPADLELAEMREIARAERMLADDPRVALALSRSIQVSFPHGNFREERAYIEVMALERLGRTRKMRESAAAFVRAYPRGRSEKGAPWSSSWTSGAFKAT